MVSRNPHPMWELLHRGHPGPLHLATQLLLKQTCVWHVVLLQRVQAVGRGRIHMVPIP